MADRDFVAVGSQTIHYTHCQNARKTRCQMAKELDIKKSNSETIRQAKPI